MCSAGHGVGFEMNNIGGGKSDGLKLKIVEQAFFGSETVLGKWTCSLAAFPLDSGQPAESALAAIHTG